jgi:hypothetical protein
LFFLLCFLNFSWPLTVQPFGSFYILPLWDVKVLITTTAQFQILLAKQIKCWWSLREFDFQAVLASDTI